MAELIIDVQVDKNGEIRIKKLKQETDKLETSTKKASKANSNFNTSLAKLAVKAAAATVAITAVAVATKKIIDTFIELENAQIGVQKTTGLTDEAFMKLNKSLQEMSVTMDGLEVKGLYDIAEAAGQLGIQGVKDITEFTRVIGMVGLTTDLSAREAGTAFAKLSKQLQEPISNIETLASVFNELSNTTAATVGDLLGFSSYMAGAAKTVGLSTASIAGLSATMADLGINVESGGSAMSQVFLKMVGDSDKFAKALGMDAKEYADIIDNEPIEALNRLLKVMSTLSSGDQINLLKNLGLGGIRTSATILKISGSTDTLAKNLRTANKEYKIGTSIQKEYDVASKGLEAQLTKMDNAFAMLSITIGAELKPSLIEASSASTTFLLELNKLIRGTSEYQVELDFTIATISRTVDVFALLFGSIKNGAELAVDGLNIVVYGALDGLAKVSLEATKALNKVNLASDESLKGQIEYANFISGAYKNAINGSKEDQEDMQKLWDNFNITVEERVKKMTAAHIKEKAMAQNNLDLADKSVKAVSQLGEFSLLLRNARSSLVVTTKELNDEEFVLLKSEQGGYLTRQIQATKDLTTAKQKQLDVMIVEAEETDTLNTLLAEQSTQIENIANRALKTSADAWIRYYETIGNKEEEWSLKSEQLFDQYKNIIGEEKAREMADAYKKNGLDKMEKDSKSTWEDMQKTLDDTLTSSFQDFFDVTSEGFGDLESLGIDMINAIYQEMLKKQVAQPISSALTSGIGSIFGFADGGVMSSQGSLPLNAYASGGIATNPQVAVFGEGSMNEAFVPLPDGRSIPVTMSGGGGSNNTIINLTNESGMPLDLQILSESMSQDGTLTIDGLIVALNNNPDLRTAVKGVG